LLGKERVKDGRAEQIERVGRRENEGRKSRKKRLGR
jgi:hypothetical protein